MVKVKVTMGTTYCGCPSETFELECYDMEEYESDEFSTEILNQIFNRMCPHFFIDIETEEIEDEDEDEDYDDNLDDSTWF